MVYVYSLSCVCVSVFELPFRHLFRHQLCVAVLRRIVEPKRETQLKSKQCGEIKFFVKKYIRTYIDDICKKKKQATDRPTDRPEATT